MSAEKTFKRWYLGHFTPDLFYSIFMHEAENLILSGA